MVIPSSTEYYVNNDDITQQGWARLEGGRVRERVFGLVMGGRRAG